MRLESGSSRSPRSTVRSSVSTMPSCSTVFRTGGRRNVDRCRTGSMTGPRVSPHDSKAGWKLHPASELTHEDHLSPPATRPVLPGAWLFVRASGLLGRPSFIQIGKYSMPLMFRFPFSFRLISLTPVALYIFSTPHLNHISRIIFLTRDFCSMNYIDVCEITIYPILPHLPILLILPILGDTHIAFKKVEYQVPHLTRLESDILYYMLFGRAEGDIPISFKVDLASPSHYTVLHHTVLFSPLRRRGHAISFKKVDLACPSH